MNVSRFFGITNREAMRQVRLALGPDALIISNRRVNGGVEILATDETSLSPEIVRRIADEEVAKSSTAGPVTMRSAISRPPAQPAPQQPKPAQPTSHAPAQAGSAAAVMPAATPSLPPGADVMGAIGALQGALESRIDELMWGNQLRRVPQAVSLFQTLLGFGFSTALLRAMLKGLPEGLGSRAALQWARTELVKSLPVLEREEALWRPGAAIALVGPTGVGKTTTVAKLAARCVKKYGAENVVLLTTDTYRIGAHEQLKIYGKMMHVPVHVVQDADELRRIIASVAAHQIIIIDNVGISQRDRFVSEQAAMLSAAGREVSRLLVLNASSHGDTLDEVARRYTHDGGSPLRGSIITKIDEATRLGAVLDTVIRYQLPVCYVSDGQKVPQNLAHMTANELVDKALVKHQQASALYAPSEADFAALMSMSEQSRPRDDKAGHTTQRRALLPNLLTVARSSKAPLEVDEIEQAGRYIDENVLASETYALWRAYFKGEAADSMGSLTQHFLGVARNEFAEDANQYVLALHDHVGLRDESSGGAGRLRATVLLNHAGVPWCSPYQQLTLPDGWRASDGETALRAPTGYESLQKQMQWAAGNIRDLPLLHLFDGATVSVWQSATAQGLAWLSACTRTTRIVDEGSATTVGAVVKTLDFHPVGALGARYERAMVQGVERGQLVVWVATREVSLFSRQNGFTPVQLVAVRVVDRRDGTILREATGLADATSVAAQTEALALALLVHAEHKTALKFAARWWPMLAQRQWADAVSRRALTATQVGLTTWDAFQSPDGYTLLSAIQGLSGKAQPNQAEAVSAMMKLFTLKEMTA
jgi:flagellar biosynthesis protein FlhF